AFDKPETLLSSADAAKIARFVNLCDSFSLPVISIIDNEGFDGVHSKAEHEHACLISGTAKLAQVYASSTTPKINLITGKATGAAFILAGGFAGDFILAYEGSVISPITVKAAAVFLEQTEADYIENEASVQNALKKGYIDMVIVPSQARNALINAVEAVRDKRVSVPARKHVNYIF
ncbi:MAG: acetyl-CoA carboxylase, partial [Oscillospiraceae bacterium]|nr:acetyl-CoA carboxylase [Oscillospiraceae bacterium]